MTPIAVSPTPRIAQPIDFTSAPATGTAGGTTELVAAGGDSGNPVTFAADPASAGVCTVLSHKDGTATVSFTGAGTCTVSAAQAGNAGYLPSTSSTSITVKAPQVLSITSSAPGAVMGGAYQATAAGGGSSAPVTWSTPTPNACSVSATGLVSLLHAGICWIVASQAGDGSHNEAPVASQEIQIARASQSVEFTHLPQGKQHVGDTFRIRATGGDSGNPVKILARGACTVSPSGKATFKHAGFCRVTAIQVGDADYQPGRAWHHIKVVR